MSSLWRKAASKLFKNYVLHLKSCLALCGWPLCVVMCLYPPTPEVPEYSFDGHSHVRYQLASPLPARRTWIQVLVRTRKHSSVLFSLISKEQSEYLRLEVSAGRWSHHFSSLSEFFVAGCELGLALLCGKQFYFTFSLHVQFQILLYSLSCSNCRRFLYPPTALIICTFSCYNDTYATDTFWKEVKAPKVTVNIICFCSHVWIHSEPIFY